MNRRKRIFYIIRRIRRSIKKIHLKRLRATPEVTEEPIAEDESTGDGESSNDEDYYVSLIKESSPEAYPDYTYGVVFDNYFSNPNWGYAEIDKQKIVDFTGGCTWNGEDVNCGKSTNSKLLMNGKNVIIKYFG